MSKYLKIFLLSMLVVSLLASAVMAGTVRVNHGSTANTPYTIAWETLGPGAVRNVTITGAAIDYTTATAKPTASNGALTFQLGQNLTSGNILAIEFTDAAFSGTTVSVCSHSAKNDAIAQATPTAGATSYNFNVNNNVAAGANIFVTDQGCTNATANSNLTIRVLPRTSTNASKVNIVNKSAGGIDLDPSTAADLATIVSQYYRSAANSQTHVIDYLGTPGNGTRVKINDAGTPVTSNIGKTSQTFDIGVRTANYVANDAGLTVSAVVSLTDSASWQGISKVFLMGHGDIACNSTSNLVGTTTLSGTVSLTIPAANFSATTATGNYNYNVCVNVNGTDALSTRTIKEAVTFNVSGNGSQAPAQTSFEAVLEFGINAYQAMIPWLVNDAAVPTYCTINNSGAVDATVYIDLVSSENGVQLMNQNLGTVASKTTKLLTFGNNSIAIAGGTPVDITSIGASKRYSTKITIGASPVTTTMTCIQTDPITNSKRMVPVLTGTKQWGY